MNKILSFESCNRGEWVNTVIRYRESITPALQDEIANIHFGIDVAKEKFEPMHIVLLSCLIDELKMNGYKVRLTIDNEKLKYFVWSEINVKEYWIGKNIVHVKSPTPSRFNLWRILEHYKDAYAVNVCRYFKGLNSQKDFSGFQTALNELYYNVFDHAEAKGNAFSYISTDNDGFVSIGVCDFGKGIARTLREAHPEYSTDGMALKYAMKPGITARSKQHNAGLGLYNIVSMLQGEDCLRIISNKSLALYTENSKKIFTLGNEFRGTLIYLRMSINSLSDEEIIESFSF